MLQLIIQLVFERKPQPEYSFLRVSLFGVRHIDTNRIITASNQLWETDIKYGWISGEQRFFFLMSILDVFDRAVITYHLGLTYEAKQLVQILQEALMKRQLFDKPAKPVIRSDNGPQFISHLFEDTCKEFGMIHERIPPKTPNKNAHIESYHSIIEAECYQRHEFETYPQTYNKSAPSPLLCMVRRTRFNIYAWICSGNKDDIKNFVSCWSDVPNGSYGNL